jgi:hypothetical protein
MSVLVALEWHYFQELLNWWHSLFKGAAARVWVLLEAV